MKKAIYIMIALCFLSFPLSGSSAKPAKKAEPQTKTTWCQEHKTACLIIGMAFASPVILTPMLTCQDPPAEFQDGDPNYQPLEKAWWCSR